MSTSTATTPPAQHYPTGKILVAGLITIVVSVVLNYLILWIATGLLGLETDFAPFAEPATFAIFTTFFLVVATLVWWWIARRSATPERTFKNIALVALVLSMIPDVLILFMPVPAESGTPTIPAVLLLMLMHVVSWYVAITVLPRFSRE